MWHKLRDVAPHGQGYVRNCSVNYANLKRGKIKKMLNIWIKKLIF